MDTRTLADSIITQVTAREAAARYGYAPNRQGFICCPFHGEKTPSLKLRNNERGFVCFGCGQKGSVIDFIGKLFDLNFIESCRKINADFGLNLPIDQPETQADREHSLRMQREREAARKQKRKAENEYWLALDIFRLFDVWYQNNQPQTQDEPWSELFMIGLRWRSIAKFNLEEKTWAMLKH
ncbi:MAG: CHC2 zinc finger domain-containing protein [Phycisphaerae bacterium]|jgi:hypothetical protein